MEYRKSESTKLLTLSPQSCSMPIIKEFMPKSTKRLSKTLFKDGFNSNNEKAHSNTSNEDNTEDKCNNDNSKDDSKQLDSILISKTSTIINECPGGDKCVNLPTIQNLTNQINKLKAILEDTNQLNNFFVYNINLKDDLYKSLLKENNSIKIGRLNSKESLPYTPSTRRIQQQLNQQQKQQQQQIQSTLYSPSKDTIKKKTVAITPLTNVTSNIIVDYKHRIPQSSSQIISLFKKDENKKKQITSILNSNYYENITKFSNKTSKHQMHSTGISYLSMSIDKLKEVTHNENMEFIKSLTQSEDYFVSKLRCETREYLINFNEYLRNITKEYKQFINLMVRIKQFISSNNDIVNTLFASNSTEVFLDHTCKLLDCERSMLCLYDSISDRLQVYTGGNIRKAPLKISKTKGIIGRVFQRGEKVKIDDTEQDARFKREDESKDKNYKIRNLLCYPLIDNHGNTFGVVQAINKRDKFFNNDDEEFMTIFTKVSSAVLNSKKMNDDNIRQILRLEKIIKYSNDIRGIQDRDKLMEKTEYVLNSIFNSGKSQFVFVVNGELVHYNRKFPKVDNIGIMHLVIKKKECHGCSVVKRCKYYNSLVDIDTSDSLMTYPIMYKEDCIAIAQVSLTEKISEVTHKPKEREMQLLNLIQSCVIEWHLDNNANDDDDDSNLSG